MLDVPLEEILPVSPPSALKLIISAVVSKEISFLGGLKNDFELPCVSPLPLLKKNGSRLVIPRAGGEVIVEQDDAVDSYWEKKNMY